MCIEDIHKVFLEMEVDNATRMSWKMMQAWVVHFKNLWNTNLVEDSNLCGVTNFTTQGAHICTCLNLYHELL